MIEVNPQQRWAVIGGGLLGMTLALRLAQQRKVVTLFEAAPSFGGLASAWQLGDVVWDRHYHVTLYSDKYLRSVLRELGLEDEMQWTTTRTGFYVDSRFHSMSNTLEFLRFSPLSLVDKVRLAATILYASRVKDWKSLEKISVEDWLQKWSGPSVMKKIWLPLLRAKLGENYRHTSAAFIWATIGRMYAARRTGMKRELFGYVPGGYARIIQHFERVLCQEGVRCQVGHPVKTVTSENSGEMRIEFRNGTMEAFDRVVVTTAAPLAAKMCIQLSHSEKRRLKSIKYQGIICASLLLKQSLSGFYITNITDSRIPYTAVIEMSALVDRKYFGGRALVYLPKYVSPDCPDFDLSDEQVKGRFLEALKGMYPHFRPEDLLCFQVSRVKYLLPISTINYSSNLPGIFTSVAGLHIVNSSQIVNGTLNANETIHLAESAAQGFAKQPRIDDELPELPTYDPTEADRQPLAGSR